MSPYKVALEVYNGPLDLLLFLIRRDEIDIYDIPISRITEQYLEYVRLLQQVDPDVVSEFLVVAASLIEIKSRMLLPTPPPEEAQEEFVDPRLELVRQLLEYKKYKDAARALEDAAEERAMRHARSPALPPSPVEEVSLENLDLWDLLEAFNRVLKQIGKTEAFHNVGVDDTPISLHAADIVDSIQRAGGGQRFEEVFAGRKRGELIGMFLALLELIRQRRVRASQDRPFGPIQLLLLDARPLDEIVEAVSDTDRETHAMEADAANQDDLGEGGELTDEEAAAWLQTAALNEPAGPFCSGKASGKIDEETSSQAEMRSLAAEDSWSTNESMREQNDPKQKDR